MFTLEEQQCGLRHYFLDRMSREFPGSDQLIRVYGLKIYFGTLIPQSWFRDLCGSDVEEGTHDISYCLTYSQFEKAVSHPNVVRFMTLYFHLGWTYIYQESYHEGIFWRHLSPETSYLGHSPIFHSNGWKPFSPELLSWLACYRIPRTRVFANTYRLGTEGVSLRITPSSQCVVT